MQNQMQGWQQVWYNFIMINVTAQDRRVLPNCENKRILWHYGEFAMKI